MLFSAASEAINSEILNRVLPFLYDHKEIRMSLNSTSTTHSFENVIWL